MAPLRLAVKAVPGARKDEIAGRLGDRLKVRVSAPPEGGRANQAICTLIAEALGLHARKVRVISGHARAEKVLQIAGATPEQVARLLG
jgi:uncharacterized protein (TIGR00251 family)